MADASSRQRGGSQTETCGPCSSPRSKSSCTWSSRHWARSLHRSLRLQAECSGSTSRHSSSLSSQRCLQRIAPRLVTTRYTLGKSAMASTAPSSGKTSSVKGKRYSYLPLLTASVMVSRSASAFSLPFPPAASAPLSQIASSRHRRTFRQLRGATAGSGLRLCVKDGLLQTCVLLATQDVNSRIHWSVSQECQHVLWSDIKPYTRSFLAPRPRFFKRWPCRPTSCSTICQLRVTLAPEFEAGVRLLQGGRRPSTVKSYDQKWLKFENFTTHVQDDAGAPRMSVLPASSQKVVAYLGYLLESGTISAKSLQPYLSAINAVHNDFEYPPPACGHLVKLARKGFAELQGSSMLQPQQVTAFPAEHMLTIVMYGLRPDASKHQIRVCACLVAQFDFFSRADSGVFLTGINAQV